MILEPPDKVQKLQAALQAKAKGSPGYRFYLLLIVKFKDAAAIEGWHGSPGYQALIPLRDEVMDSNFLVMEEPT